MKILFLSHSPNNPNGGASRIYHILTEGLRARGHSVTMLHLEDFHPARFKPARLLIQRVAMPQWISQSVAKLDFTEFDLVMSSSGMAYPLFQRLRSRKKRPVLINHIHGLAVYDHLATLSETKLGHWKTGLPYRLLTGPFQLKWDAAGIRWSDVTIVQNMRDLGQVRDVMDRSHRVVMIPAAVHPVLLAASDSPSDVKRPPARILWFASWDARKGVHYLPAAFRQVRQKRPEATLVLGGTGQAAPDILSLFAPEDRDAVQVLPPISIPQQIDLLRSCSIFLFPSLSEGFGLALLEAMCFGLAAVTTQTGFGGDYLTDGESARVVHPSAPHLARALLDLIERDNFRQRLASAGRDLARTFTAERMLDGYEQAFAEARQDRLSQSNGS